MTAHELEKRQYARIGMARAAAPEGRTPDEPLILNVSPGGACVWLLDPPPVERGLELQFRFDGQDHLLRARIVWTQLCTPTSGHKHPQRAEGWLAGVAFTDAGAGILPANVSPDILRASQATVRVGGNGAHAVDPHRITDGQEAPGVIALSEESIPAFKAATHELIPIFSRYFSDVRLVLTRHRVEISASFRPPASASPPDGARPDPRAIAARPAAQPAASTREPAPAADVPIKRHHVARVAVATVAAVALAATFAGVGQKRKVTPAATGISMEERSTPAWASGFDGVPVKGWAGIQAQFNLPDAAVRSAMRILRTNDKYAAGQRLHDLTKYPAQVKRAFALLAGLLAGAGERFDLDALVSDLQARVVQGVRFPDEAPGGRYSSLQQELFNNIVVLGVVELLHRRQGDPAAQEILAALREARA